MPIAFLTDFGTRDYFVGSMKGVILGINRKATVIDITHEIEPHNIREAAFTLAACWRDFPEGTIFVCVIDPGVGSSRRAIAGEIEGRKFVCPDNGLLGRLIDEAASIHELTNAKYFRQDASNTFHGRDIFAPVAAYLSLGVPLEEFGPKISDPLIVSFAKPYVSGGDLHGEVIHIDRFGNAVTNLSPGMLQEGSVITVNGVDILQWMQNYAQADADEPFLIIGSAGFIEISVNGSSAAVHVPLRIGDKVIASPAAGPGET